MEIFITGLLNEFLSFVPNALTGDEVVLYANNILSDLPTWSTADLTLCLKNGIAGKYGPIKFRWTWTSDFIEWIRKYEQEKQDFIDERELQKTNNGRITDAQIISLFPPHILEKFKKENLDKKAEEKMNFKIPNEISKQGPDAVDAYIENMRSKIK